MASRSDASDSNFLFINIHALKAIALIILICISYVNPSAWRGIVSAFINRLKVIFPLEGRRRQAQGDVCLGLASVHSFARIS